MTDERPTNLELRLPPDPQLLRVLRLVGSGMASLGQLDLAGTEEVRLAVDELGAALIEMGDGSPVEITFELTATALCIEGSTALGAGRDLELDPMTDRMLDAVVATHEWTLVDGRVTARLEKPLPEHASPAGSAPGPGR